MPNKPAAWKHLRQTKRRTARNQSVRAGIEFLRRKFAKALGTKDAGAAREAFRNLQKSLDRAAEKGVIKDNTASRLKSRAAAKVRAVG
jgi:small subunit ribosomal protein S20